MCIEVAIEQGADSTVCRTREELELALGGQAIGHGSFDGDWKPGDCLCHCDLSKTSKQFGFKVNVVQLDKFEFRKVKASDVVLP